MSESDVLLRHRWAPLLAAHGLNLRALKAGRAKPDALTKAAESAGFTGEMIAEVVRLFSPAPQKVPPPAISISREARVELLRQRLDAGMLLYNRRHDIIRGMLDDHVGHEPEGKRLVSWYEAEVEIEDELNREAARPVAELDYLDELPRRRWREFEERQQAGKAVRS